MKGETMNKTVILSWDDGTVCINDAEGNPIAELDWPDEEDLQDSLRQVVEACGMEFVWFSEPEVTANGWQCGVTVKP